MSYKSPNQTWPDAVHDDFAGFTRWLQKNFRELNDAQYEIAMKRYDMLEKDFKDTERVGMH